MNSLTRLESSFFVRTFIKGSHNQLIATEIVVHILFKHPATIAQELTFASDILLSGNGSNTVAGSTFTGAMTIVPIFSSLTTTSRALHQVVPRNEHLSISPILLVDRARTE